MDKTKTNSDFPRILALLRKERKLSQKEAAGQLGITQALLSHYEKGKRECGLAFLVKAADFYNVSTDYMLGRSAVSDGTVISERDIPLPEDGNEKPTLKNISLTLSKKMLISGINVTYSLLMKIGNQKLTRAITEIFTLSVYSCFRLIHRVNPRNDPKLFAVEEETALRAATAGRLICESTALTESYTIDSNDLPLITTATLEKEYNKEAVALLSLIKNSEKIFHVQ